MTIGALVLVATPIGNLGDLSPRAIDALRTATVIAAEDTRRTRGLLTHAGISAGSRLRAVHGHNERAQAALIVEEIRAGARVAYVTDAGMPGVSDPGERLVRACLDAGLPVELVPGPSAALSALVLSGLPTARFAFEGFLPRKGHERRDRLAEIAAADRTTVVFEAANRVGATLTALASVCGPDRAAAVAREGFTKLHEEVARATLGALVEQVTTTPPRGECVIVVGPAPRHAVTDEEVGAAAAEIGSREGPARALADALAEQLGISRRRAYEAVLEQRRR